MEKSKNQKPKWKKQIGINYNWRVSLARKKTADAVFGESCEMYE